MKNTESLINKILALQKELKDLEDRITLVRGSIARTEVDLLRLDAPPNVVEGVPWRD